MFFYIEYLSIFVFLCFAVILSIVIFGLSIIFATHKAYPEKITSYECGFDPFEDARNEFDVRFYLVAILFLLFDIEASFLFPWVVNLSHLSSFGFWVIFDFFFELAIGFFYVWKVGALEWS